MHTSFRTHIYFSLKECLLVACGLLIFSVTLGQPQPVSRIEDAENALDKRNWVQAIQILGEMYDTGSGTQTFEYSNVVCNLGYAHSENGDLVNGRKFLVEGINIKRQGGWTTDIYYARALQNLGGVLKDLGNYDQAKVFLEESINVIGSNIGKNNHDYAVALSNLASFFNLVGEYSEAYNFYTEAHNIINLIHDENTPEYAEICGKLGEILIKNGAFSQAEEYILASVDIYEKLGEDYILEYAEGMESLGVLYEVEGKYAESESVLLETLKIKQGIPNLDEQLLIKTYNDLGILYQHLGNFDKAEEYFTRVYEMSIRILGRDHSFYAVSVNNLAAIADKKEEFHKAKTLFSEALQVYEKVHGKNHPLYADCLNNLASTESKLGLYDDAEVHYREVTELDKVIYGEKHPHYATTLNNYGMLLFRKGNIEKAEGLYLEALEIREETLGKNHPSFSRSLENIGLYYYESRNLYVAEDFFRQSIEIQKSQITSIFPALTENERQAFYRTITYDIERYNHIALDLLDEKPELINYILNNQIQTKAILLNASEKERRSILNSGNQELIEDFRKWTSLKNDLVRYYHVGLAKMAEYGLNVDDLENEIDLLEKKIIGQVGQFDIVRNAELTWKDIQAALEPGEAIVEILKVREFDKNEIEEDLAFGFGDDSEYLAIIMKSGNAPLEYVVIENGFNLEEVHYLFYSNSLKYHLNDQDSYKYFWKDIDKKLKGINQVYLSPDGIYHKVNPNVFRDSKNSFLFDKYYVSLITNCSDLLKDESEPAEYKRAYLVGNPKFNLKKRESVLNQLPGSKVEVTQIQNLLESEGDWDVRTFTEEKATEARIKSYYQPRLLHIATHGFFADDQDAITTKLLPKQSHPLFKSGIYLAGVEDALNSYNNGNPADPFNDGVLTAFEAMNLNLDKTDIVVLSACNTGLGTVENGEGVFGLQRAFMVAGAKNLIISIAEVDDIATQKMMGYFYENYGRKVDISKALKNAQDQIRKEYDDPLVWGSFMLIGTGKRS